MKPQTALSELAAKTPVPIIGQTHPLDAWLKLIEQRLLHLVMVGDPKNHDQYLQSRRRIFLESLAELLAAERDRVTRIHQLMSEKHGTEVHQFSSACLAAVNHPGMEPQPREER